MSSQRSGKGFAATTSQTVAPSKLHLNLRVIRLGHTLPLELLNAVNIKVNPFDSGALAGLGDFNRLGLGGNGARCWLSRQASHDNQGGGD